MYLQILQVYLYLQKIYSNEIKTKTEIRQLRDILKIC